MINAESFLFLYLFVVVSSLDISSFTFFLSSFANCSFLIFKPTSLCLLAVAKLPRNSNEIDPNQGVVVKQNYFGGLLEAEEMHRDDLWWNSAPEIESRANRRVEVKPNPMVLKAEQIFRDALKK